MGWGGQGCLAFTLLSFGTIIYSTSSYASAIYECTRFRLCYQFCVKCLRVYSCWVCVCWCASVCVGHMSVRPGQKKRTCRRLLAGKQNISSSALCSANDTLVHQTRSRTVVCQVTSGLTKSDNLRIKVIYSEHRKPMLRISGFLWVLVKGCNDQEQAMGFIQITSGLNILFGILYNPIIN